MALSANATNRLRIALANPGAGNEVVDAIENPTFGEDATLSDGIDLGFGDGQLVLLRWSEADVSNPSFVIALDDTNQGVHITDKGAVATDWNISATTHPNVYIHSNTTPATDYLRIGGHDGTIADIDVVGGTTLRLMAAGTSMVTITATAITLADAQNVVLNATTGTKIGTATTQKLGFFNATPVVQCAAIVQTFATADRTHAARTATVLTDNTVGTANTTLEALADGTTYATDVAAIRNNFADLAAAVNALIVDLADTASLVNSLVDDHQALGLAG